MKTPQTYTGKPDFTAAFFAANRQRLNTLFAGTAPIVITANGLLQSSNDTTFPFQQDSNFWYLTGINEPDLILVMDKGKEYLIVPRRSESREAFDGSIRDDELVATSGINHLLNEKEGWRLLGSRLKKVKHVATMAPPKSYIEQLGMFTNPARRKLVQDMKKYNQDIEFLDLRPQLTKMRSIKQPLELQAMQSAIDLTVKTFNRVRRSHFARFAYEYEIEAVMTEQFRRHNTDHGYEPIIASGQHACTLHYITNNSLLDPKGVLLIDAAASVGHYTADITRSYTMKTPTARQQAVHAAVLAVQEFALAQLKPGINLREFEQNNEHFMGEKLRELGLIKTIDHQSVRRYYPHATSHFLGLDTHDVGDYDAPLEASMVITVEPGIYIPEESLGIRIEDDILITSNGFKVLSKKLPQDLY